MRDILFLLIFVPMPFICILKPWLGMLIWAWFAYTYPMSGLWGIASSLPGNMIITGSVLLGWLLARDEPKLPPFDRTTCLLIALALFTAVSITQSLSPFYTSIKTTEYASIFLYIMLLSIFLRSEERINAFVWMACFSIGYFAVRGSLYYIASGGGYHIEGPYGTQLWDRNHLAVACLLVIPLMNYLRLHTRHRWVSLCLLGTMVLTALCVVATFSRGGLIGLVVLGGYLWWNAGRKISHAALIAAGFALVLYSSSDAWLDRMQSIDTAAEEDESFVSRLDSWAVYWRAAVDRPLTGAGPKALEDPEISVQYQGDRPDPEKTLAAHSIYFQLMGEEGFLALGAYLLMLLTAWANGGWVARRARGHPDLAWAAELGRMAQVSIVVFAITAAALSLAFFDLLFSIVVLLAALRRLVTAKLDEKSGVAAKTRRSTPLMRPAPAGGSD